MTKFSRRNAFALVLVMITIVLAATMAVFFLGSAGRERRGVDLYARGSQVRQLAQMAVNRVIGQIGAATKEGTSAAPVSWASQPGMVRTYSQDGSTKSIYKLYSWDNLWEAGAGFDANAAAQLPPTGWKSNPALFTDLNQAINDIYPIVDPRAQTLVSGFSIDTANGAVAGTGSDAPMPVKWLYILEDGQMVAPTGGSGNTAVVAVASATNPIVGRVAFWTDDDTSKVNINTASEGAFWDAPRSGSRDDMQFAANPPVRNEFQRTGGHPAMTALSAVFPEFLTTSDRWANPGTFRSELQRIYQLAPRIQSGGSEGGTLPVSSYSTDYSLSTLPVMPTKITLDSDRLYASPDDFWFDPTRTANTAFTAAAAPVSLTTFRQRLFFLTSYSRAPETTLFETPRISLWPITWPYRSSYFSMLKDLNTFRGRNGVPVTPPLPTQLDPNTTAIAQNPWMTAEERLLAFCATLNVGSASETKYYFQRQNPDSSTYDWNNISRNQDLVKYLRASMARNEPGFGGSLAGKWGGVSADWIAINTLDYCRSMINQATMASTGSNAVTPGSNEVGYSYTGLSSRDIWINGTHRQDYIEPNSYTVAPLRATLNGNTYTGQGAYPQLDQVSLMFYATARREPQAPSSPSTAPPHTTPADNDYYNPFNWKFLINSGPAYGGSADYPVGNQTTQMKAVMLFHFSGLNAAGMTSTPFVWVKVKGPQFTVNGSSINLPVPGGRSIQWGAYLKGTAANPLFYPLFQKLKTSAKVFSNAASGANSWSLISDGITIDPTAVDFQFGGSVITVEIYAPYSSNLETDPTGDSAQLVSSQQIDFTKWNTGINGTGKLPVPMAPRWNIRDGLSVTTPAGKPINRPDPSATAFLTPESRAINWAYTEIVPNYVNNPPPPTGTEVLRDNLAAQTNRAIAYAYISNTGTLVSPVFENRVLSLNGRNTSVFKAENTAAELSYASVDAPFLEGVPLITPYDTVISMVLDPSGNGNGDPRLANVVTTTYGRIDDVLKAYNNTLQPDLVLSTSATTAGGACYPRSTARAQYHQLGTPGTAGPLATGYRQNIATLGASKLPFAQVGRVGYNPTQLGYGGTIQTIESVVGGSFTTTNNIDTKWDWTNSPGNGVDGGILNRPDQDYQSLFVDYSASSFVGTPYFLVYGTYGSPGTNYFSPNRQVSSPVILGTLPSSTTTGWQTLAFSPNPATGSSHPGLATPPDHLLLDLLWMPVAEPYPISDQFSTAGKINLNYAIMPFSYLHRKTGLYAALKSTWLTALPDSSAANYKSHYNFRSGGHTRYTIDIGETLKDFDSKFATGDIFRSASQICEMFLVPQGESLASTKTSFWNTQHVTADNSREEPYDQLYSRVTTKSNTFTVHWRVQVLRKQPNSVVTTWDESKDKVGSELRGSTTLERFLDPNATNIPDYATDFTAKPLSNFYKWRTISENYFQP